MDNKKYENIAVSKYADLPYRRGVGVMILNSVKKVFVGKRIDTKNNAWQMPQGGIDEDETLLEAGVRELFEETNIQNIEILAETKNWLYYDLPEFLIGRLWGGKYRGQKQKWLLIKFTGNDEEININKSNQEFKQWKWIEVEELPEVVVAFKKQLYTSIVKEFASIISTL